MPGDNESSQRDGSFCSSYFFLPSAGSRLGQGNTEAKPHQMDI